MNKLVLGEDSGGIDPAKTHRDAQSPSIAEARFAQPSASEPEWYDLALNKPGQAARAKAIELKRAAPVRTFIARVLNVHTEERAFRIGADGEEEVARRLARLRQGWHTLHAIPVGEKDSDIDHIVIGPPGVFTLNTKNHPRGSVWVAERVVMVNGQKTDYLRNSRHEAQRATRLLSSRCGFTVKVEPVLVVMARKLTIKALPDAIHVVKRLEIDRWLRRLPRSLSSEQVEAIYNWARRSSTWRPDESAPR